MLVVSAFARAAAAQTDEAAADQARVDVASHPDQAEVAVEQPKRSERSAPPPFGARFAEPLEGAERLRVRYHWRRAKHQGLLLADRDARPGYVRDRPVPLVDYEETPRAFEVSVHTLEFAYAPHPRTTLILQAPFLQKDLETLEASGDRRRDQTEGLGDVTLGLVVPFIRRGHESSHVHIAFDVPSGSIRKEDDDGRRLPYDLQLGNGTVDFEWGWTYRGALRRFAWGGQAFGRHPLGRNSLDYREGSRFEASLWGGARLIGGLSASLRVQWQKQNNLEHWDSSFVEPVPDGEKQLEVVVDPAENGKARGGTRFLLGPSLAYDFEGRLAGQRLAAEVAVPVHQDLDGPQLEQDWVLHAGWQWAF